MSSLHHPDAGTASARTSEARHRAQALYRSAAAEFEAVTRLLRQAQQTCADLRALLDASVPAHGRGAAPARTLAQALDATGLTRDDLVEMADDLIAAYRNASAAGDDARSAALAQALRTIGRHLAGGLGPRAAGAVLH
ncbi:hypothetical protein Q8W71_12985 [Methylobacterium sp. NEAU 140]|uniref:hypothetical protein n=1 Tax=Methylobacterium sp. NEAU 140 TaxID=3064945 RepID=UPI00273762A3|nr:hypothetical protein [Methylobacterium sp. NEAU 140]MDP4023546.1 hypothetical protein [Methylobacterium sp. NEAU 140]